MRQVDLVVATGSQTNATVVSYVNSQNPLSAPPNGAGTTIIAGTGFVGITKHAGHPA